jgi:hypothetical protein
MLNHYPQKLQSQHLKKQPQLKIRCGCKKSARLFKIFTLFQPLIQPAKESALPEDAVLWF